MKLLLQLSLRNLLRHKRRNLMLLAAIAVAVAGVNATNTLLRGYQHDMLETVIANLTGHVKVHAPGYRDDPTISRGFELEAGYAPSLAADQLVGWAARVQLPGVIMSERETRGVQVVGIDPDAEAISFIRSVALQGEFLSDPQDKRVVIGKELARQLETEVGRRLVILTQGIDGKNRERGYRIAGTFDAEGTALEKNYVFVGLARLQNLLDSPAVTEVSFRLTDEQHREQAKQRLLPDFDDLEVKDWRELEPQTAEMFSYADMTLYIWFGLMMGALTFGLVNSLIAAVMERVKELGMLRALGMRRRTVILQVVLESMMMMFAGVLLGTVFGVLAFLGMQDGIDLSAWAEGAELVGMSTLLVPVLLPGDLLQVAWMSMVLGLFASLYPAWRVVRLAPLEALRG